MSWKDVGNLALDSLLDSLKVFALAFVLYILISFIEDKMARFLSKKSKTGPIFGSLSGAIPQCGISVVGADLFMKGDLTLGTLIAIFIACSDEALPIIFGNFEGKWYMGFLLVAIKVVYAAAIGVLVDLVAHKRKHEDPEEHHDDEIHIGCCHHSIEENELTNPWKEHLLHPLWHSFKIFIHAYVVSFMFGLLVLWIGEEAIASFVTSNYYLSPLLAIVVGLIPNCASSILIADFYMKGLIPFGALIAGLSANAGLGPLYLFKKKDNIKNALIITGLQIVFAVIIGYSCIWISL